MMKRSIAFILIFVILFGIACVQVCPQDNGEKNFLMIEASPKMKKRLKARVEMLVNFDKKKEYQKLYKLLAKEQRDGYGSEEVFFKFRKKVDAMDWY